LVVTSDTEILQAHLEKVEMEKETLPVEVEAAAAITVEAAV
jgi:hypothetical protein